MKKMTLILVATTFMAISANAQKVTKMELLNESGEVVTSLAPTAGVAYRLWGYNHERPNIAPTPDAEIIYPVGTDLTSVKLRMTLKSSDQDEIDVRKTWEEKQIFSINNEDGEPVEGSVFLKVLKPTTLPMTATTAGLLDWHKDVEGWAGAGVMNLLGDVLYGDKVVFKMKAEHSYCSYIMAFSDTPSELTFLVEGTDVDQSGALSEIIFDVTESADGITWTPIVQYVSAEHITEDGSVKQEMLQGNGFATPYISSLLPASRYVRFHYTSSYFRGGMSTDNVVLMSASISKGGAGSSIEKHEVTDVTLNSSYVGDELHVTSTQDIREISIINIHGMEVSSAVGARTVGVSSLATGCYFARVKTIDGNITNLRFMKK